MAGDEQISDRGGIDEVEYAGSNRRNYLGC
jgi:hypothetical protein